MWKGVTDCRVAGSGDGFGIFRIVENSFGLEDLFVSQLMDFVPFKADRDLLVAIGRRSLQGLFAHLFGLCPCVRVTVGSIVQPICGMPMLIGWKCCSRVDKYTSFKEIICLLLTCQERLGEPLASDQADLQGGLMNRTVLHHWMEWEGLTVFLILSCMTLEREYRRRPRPGYQCGNLSTHCYHEHKEKKLHSRSNSS